jgi:hypothetical protein
MRPSVDGNWQQVLQKKHREHVSSPVLILIKLKELVKCENKAAVRYQKTIDTVERMVKAHKNNIEQGGQITIPFKELVGVIDEVDSQCVQTDEQCRDYVAADRENDSLTP